MKFDLHVQYVIEAVDHEEALSTAQSIASRFSYHGNIEIGHITLSTRYEPVGCVGAGLGNPTSPAREDLKALDQQRERERDELDDIPL